jgi:MYXO-CTERM domain-containing protein
VASGPDASVTCAHHLGRAAAICVAALLACALLGAAATGAHAHEVDADVRFVIESISPEVEGLTFVVVRGLAPQVVVENRTDLVLEALDEEGRPFVRIGPDGVEADQAAYAWVDTADPSGVPPGLDLPRDLPPSWSPVRDEPSWGWFDHRLHEQDLRFDAPAEGATVLDRWELDFRYDDQPLTISGRTERRPVEGVTLAALTGGNQPLPGVLVQVLPGELPGLIVTSSVPLTVLGQDGEPFLRFGPDGVEANERSSTWLLSGRAATEGTDPGEVDLDPDADPVWLAVSDGASFGWIDPRLAAPDQLPAGTEVPDGGFATLATWQLPLVGEDGAPTSLEGETRYVPVPVGAEDETAGWGPSLLAAAVAAVLLVAAVALRRRRQRTVASAGPAARRG